MHHFTPNSKLYPVNVKYNHLWRKPSLLHLVKHTAYNQFVAEWLLSFKAINILIISHHWHKHEWKTWEFNEPNSCLTSDNYCWFNGIPDWQFSSGTYPFFIWMAGNKAQMIHSGQLYNIISRYENKAFVKLPVFNNCWESKPSGCIIFTIQNSNLIYLKKSQKTRIDYKTSTNLFQTYKASSTGKRSCLSLDLTLC